MQIAYSIQIKRAIISYASILNLEKLLATPAKKVQREKHHETECGFGQRLINTKTINSTRK